MFRVGHLFTRIELWEADIAKRLNDRTSSLEKMGRLGQIPLILIGLLYTIFAVLFRIVMTVLLVSLFWLLRFVIPVFYLVLAFWFGITSTFSLYNSVTDWVVSEESLLSLSHLEVMQIAPALFVIVLYLTFYISCVYVVGRMYTKQVYDDGVTNENQ